MRWGYGVCGSAGVAAAAGVQPRACGRRRIQQSRSYTIHAAAARVGRGAGAQGAGGAWRRKAAPPAGARGAANIWQSFIFSCTIEDRTLFLAIQFSHASARSFTRPPIHPL
jgi:hypothetical protein